MATYYWVGGNGTWDNSNKTNWATVSGGAGGNGPPTSADTVNFDAASGTGTCTTASGSACAIATLNSSTLGVTLGANHTMSGTFTLTLGTLSLGSYTLSCNIFLSSNSNIRTISFGTGSITLTGSNTTIWSTTTQTNFSYTGTPTVNCTYSGSTGTRTVNTGSNTELNSLNFNVTAGSDIFAISNAKNLNFTGFSGSFSNTTRNIFGSLTVSSSMTLTAGANATTFAGTSGTQQITTNGKTLDFPLIFNGIGGTFAFQDALTQGSTRAFTITNGTIQLKNGVTSTVGSFVTSGTNQKYFQSTAAGSQATLSQASGTVGTSYLTIQDINATGGATWNSFYANNNVDAGNNTNWNFGATPILGAEYTYKLRSFTQPRRF